MFILLDSNSRFLKQINYSISAKYSLKKVIAATAELLQPSVVAAAILKNKQKYLVRLECSMALKSQATFSAWTILLAQMLEKVAQKAEKQVEIHI
jgi:hypothetical protein